MFFQEVANGVFWSGLGEQILDEVFVNVLPFGWLQFADLCGHFLKFCVPVGNTTAVADDGDLDVGCLFDLEQVSDVVFVEEGNIGALLACSACSAGTVDVWFWVFGWRELDDELDIGNVDASGCHIGGN